MRRNSLLRKILSTCIAGVMSFSAVSSVVSASEYGVDISRYQGNINWDEFKDSGMSFAILRAGTTKYGIDSKFEEYYQGTRDAGVKAGAYLFISAMTLEEFKDAAEQFVKYLDGKNWEMPVYVDLEENDQTTLGRQTLTTYALACMNIIRNAGYTTGLYSNLNWYTNFYDRPQIDKAGYEIWHAQYLKNAEEHLDYDKSDICDIWQYSCHGNIQGIPADVDMNIAYTIYNAERDVSRFGQPWLLPYLSRRSMKAGPGREYGDLINIPQNTLINVTEKRTVDGEDWGFFSYNGYAGWCNLEGTFDYSSASYVPENPYFFYDVNLDGTINAADEIALLRFMLGDSAEGLAADLNGDGKVNIFDRLRMKYYLVSEAG